MGNKKYRYETHLHTKPVSKCSRASVRDALTFYKEKGYEGVFVTNHFLSGQVVMENFSSYTELIDFYFSDYEEAQKIGKEIGISVLLGLEISLDGTHFLVYGLDKQWYLEHPEVCELKGTEHLKFLADNGAMIIQAHPFRLTKAAEFLTVFPRFIDGVEINNGGCTDAENKLAGQYADCFSLKAFAGSDYHGKKIRYFFGIETDKPIENEQELIRMFRDGEISCFAVDTQPNE